MATSDNGLGGMLETASAVLEAPTSETPAVETPAAASSTDDLQVLDSTSEEQHEEGSTEGKETETHNADGSEKTAEEQAAFKTAAAAKAEGKEALPSEQRAALKILRDLDPKYAGVVKSIHGAVERWNAAKELLGTGEGSGVVGLKTLLSAAGAKTLPELSQKYVEQTEQLGQVIATDELLHNADPSLSQNVFDDMKAQGSEKMYGKVVSNFVEHLKTADPNAYYEVIAKPLFLASMDEAEMPKALNALNAALIAGDSDKAKAITKNIATFYKDLRDETGEKSKISKERQAWEAERTGKETATAKAERTKAESGIAENCDKINNTRLGKALGAFLRLPYFKEFSYETKVDLGNGIKSNLYATLKADKDYQKSMDSLWRAKTLDNAKMVEVHTAKLEEIADRVVRETISKRYPGYAKGGSAAGKAAAATAKKAAGTAAANASVSTGKPIYVATKPESLIRSDIKIGGRLYTSQDLQLMLVTGKGFVKTPDNKSVKYITWRR